MLIELRIHNYALIESASIAPGAGLNVLTGETGAGKSILVQALGLLLGERAASEAVGQGGTRALVEGEFDLERVPQARAFLDEQGVACEDATLIVTREVEAAGRSRVRLNGRMATAAMLREIGALLVDFHGQHEGQRLLDTSQHLELLDAFGGSSQRDLGAEVARLWREWRAARRELRELRRSDQERAQRLDTLLFQAAEIDKARLEDGEDDALAAERARLLSVEKLRESASATSVLLWGDDEAGALTLARQALKSARELEALDASVASWTQQLESALLELEDAATSARDYGASLEADPARLEIIESRLFKLNRLRRKYGANVADVLAHRAAIESEIAALQGADERIDELAREEKERREALDQAAARLSLARRELATEFAAAVCSQIADLALEKARFVVEVAPLDAPSERGADAVSFAFSANPGQPLRPLARVASGGEVSRLLLGLRSALRARSAPESASGVVPIVVFDEIDTGIGGLTAQSVGQKIASIARDHQVFCITHLPQIARRADQHFRVEKASTADFTRVDVVPLQRPDRVIEIARMMGSETPANLEHARALLEDSFRAPSDAACAQAPPGTAVKKPRRRKSA